MHALQAAAGSQHVDIMELLTSAGAVDTGVASSLPRPVVASHP